MYVVPRPGRITINHTLGPRRPPAHKLCIPVVFAEATRGVRCAVGGAGVLPIPGSLPKNR